jgi:type IV secretion system protein VirB10
VSPKDKQAEVKPIESPSGLDLHPQPEKPARVSRRAAAMVIAIIAAVLLGYAYGGCRRTAKNEAAANQAGLPKTVAPATQAAAEFVGAIPPGNAPTAKQRELQPPADSKRPASQPCGTDRQTGNPYRYNSQTGQPCDGPQERVVVRQAPHRQLPKATESQNEPTPEQWAAAAAYQTEQEARSSPTAAQGARSFTAPSSQIRGIDAAAPPLPDLTQLLTRSQAGSPSPADSLRAPGPSGDDYEALNMQTRKQGFLNSAADRQKDDYLRSGRTAPLSRYEIKAGWEIPAVLEQSLNSDLPGELKALVATNVYDTATGMYLLIPQGSRLIGQYDSRVSYGQDAVQVIWSRIIFPDASAIDLNGMVGLDSHGNAGLRDKVDRHYKRLLGFSVLTSMFTAAFAISQQRNQSVLVNPNPGQIAAGAVGEELSQTGSQIARRNLNVQPTIKVPAGYRFTVRVNRDILFEAPYEAQESHPQATEAGH